MPRSLKLAGVTCWTKVSTSSVIVTWKIPNPKQVIIQNGLNPFCRSILILTHQYFLNEVAFHLHQHFPCGGSSHGPAVDMCRSGISHALVFHIYWRFSHAPAFHMYRRFSGTGVSHAPAFHMHWCFTCTTISSALSFHYSERISTQCLISKVNWLCVQLSNTACSRLVFRANMPWNCSIFEDVKFPLSRKGILSGPITRQRN